MSHRNLTLAILSVAILLVGAALADDREEPINPAAPQGITAEQIIQKFAAKEKQFKEAREHYTWRQSVKVMTLDGDTVDGEFQQVTDILFDDRGKRIEQVVYAPQSSLQRISMTREDFDDIEKRLPFVLTSDEVQDYNIQYAGQQRVDELDTYVFDVSPKKVDKGRRYFEGRIWVDNRDFQIVKTYGKNVPDFRNSSGENLFPKFETYREQIDGKYWFPTYTRIDDTLHFKGGDVHVRQVIKYQNYKRYGADVKITYEGQELPQDKGKDKDKPKK